MTTKQKQMKKPANTRVATSKATSSRTGTTSKASTTRAAARVAKKPSVRVAAQAKTKAKVKQVRRQAKKVLVPHKGNEFRPHLIRVHGLAAVVAIVMVVQIAYGFITTGQVSVLGRVSNIQTTELLTDTNDARATEGLPALQVNDELSKAAFLKAQNMFQEQYWAHVSPSGIQPWKWFGDVSYNYSYAGENLAKNYPTAAATVDAWMRSKTHRENIMKKEYVDVGFAVVDGTLKGENTTLVVALYGAPVTAAAVQSAVSSQPRFTVSSVATDSTSPLAYFGSAIETLSPVKIAILGLLAIVAVVGVAAHHYRKRLPKAWQKSWRAHHGLYTFVGMIALSVLVIVGAGGGSI